MLDDDVTHWISQLAEGDELAAQNIWNRYLRATHALGPQEAGRWSIVARPTRKMSCSAPSTASAKAWPAGRFPRLDDRHDLWKLLVTITARKAVAELRREARSEAWAVVRCGGESVFIEKDSSQGHGGIGEVLGREPTPEFAIQVTEQCEHVFECLEDEWLRVVALLKLEGYTNEEIARQSGLCAGDGGNVGLRRIRKKWGKGGER